MPRKRQENSDLPPAEENSGDFHSSALPCLRAGSSSRQTFLMSTMGTVFSGTPRDLREEADSVLAGTLARDFHGVRGFRMDEVEEARHVEKVEIPNSDDGGFFPANSESEDEDYHGN